jgi:hypothetical protein
MLWHFKAVLFLEVLMNVQTPRLFFHSFFALTLILLTWPNWADATPPHSPCGDPTQVRYSTYREYGADAFLAPQSPRPYAYELPIVFHVPGHRGLFRGFNISLGELNNQLQLLRETYRACDVEVVVRHAYYWDTPRYLDELNESSVDQHLIGEEERCLLYPTHQSDAINIYFVDSVSSRFILGRSHTLAREFYRLESTLESVDDRIMDSVIITDEDRTRGLAKYVVTAHEVGHTLLGPFHVLSNATNLMHDRAEFLSNSLSRAQCGEIRRSLHVNRVR